LLLKFLPMKFKFTLIVLIFIIGLISCRNSVNGQKENSEFRVSFDNCKTTVDLKLSDLIDSGRLICLESIPESLLGNMPRFIIGDEYILVVDINGILKFSKEGRFIRKVIKFGRGPQELSRAIKYYHYEKANLLFIEDQIQNKDKIQIYDIGKEKFSDPIKKCFPGRWGSFMVYNDSLIMGSLLPVVIDTMRYALFIQNFNGDFITGISNSRKVLDARLNKETVQRLDLCPGDNDIYTNYVYDDTLFRYSNNNLFPYLIVTYNSPRNYMRSMGFEVGESRVGFPQIDNRKFMVLSESVYTGPTQEGSMTNFNYKRTYYFLDKSDKSFSKINSFTDDITGKKQDCKGETLNFPTILPDDKIYISYNPQELLNVKLKENSDMPPGLSNQIREIQKNLDVMDNPVLLVGSIKKRL
jgi:hypothetical protein